MSCVGEGVGAIGRLELLKSIGGGPADIRLELGEGVFNRIEVGALVGSPAATSSLAENYVGLRFY